MRDARVWWLVAVLAMLATTGCKKKEEAAVAGGGGGGAAEPAGGGTAEPAGGGTAAAPPEQPAAPALKTDRGVDAGKKVIRVGMLNDESGPAAPIGKPFAVGKRVLVAQVNAGGSGILPDGWTVAATEKDHAYNPQKSVEAYNELKNDILFISTVFGTPNTLPLVQFLERDVVMAFPASLSSELAAHEFTPPLGPSYKVEAARAMDWVVATAGDAAAVKAGIVYQRDDYGQDGLDGWKKAAAHHGVTVVSEQTVAPGQQDMAAVITALKDAGADYVLLVTLPTATGPILGTAAQLQYGPTWIGCTPAWVDAFFSPDVIPSAVFGNYRQLSGLPYWGEDVPGMDKFLEAFKAHGGGASPDFYILASYVQGLVQLEAARRAIEAGDLTREGYRKALQTIAGWDAGGLIQPLDLSKHPYVTSTRTRVLQPDFEARSWKEVVGYAEPVAAL